MSTKFLSTAQLLQNDGIVVARGLAATPDPPTLVEKEAARLAAMSNRRIGSAGAAARSNALAAATATASSGTATNTNRAVNKGVAGDHYLTGSVIVLKNDQGLAPDPDDLHNMRKPSAAYVTKQGQITAAARSCSGELVAIPKMSGQKNNPSASHPSVDGGYRYDTNFIFRGPAEPTARTIPEEHDATIRGEVDAAQSAAAKAAQMNRWASIIQSIVRMRLARKRYLLHREKLTALLERVFWERQTRCALLIQKCGRRMVCRHRYLRMREAQWQKFTNGAKKRGGPGGSSMNSKFGSSMGGNAPAGGGAKAVAARRQSASLASMGSGKGPAPLPTEPYSWLEGIAERNFTFVVALKSMMGGKLEESKHAFEAFSQQAGQGGDKVALRLAQCCDNRLRSIAAMAAGKDGPSGDNKKAAGGKGAPSKNDRKKSVSPAPRRK